MKKFKLEIKHKFFGNVLFTYESETDPTIKEAVEQAVKEGANLEGANLRWANLKGANLEGANLEEANLEETNLKGANLEPVKNDMFIVLLHGIQEIAHLKKSIIGGKIDGSTYDGACACLSGTLQNAAKINNGEQEKNRIVSIKSCRMPSRPIERFFLGINIGDTPENSQFAKLALDWILEFENLIGQKF